MVEREIQSQRTTLVREAQNNKILELEKENKKLKETIVGLGSIVAQAQVAGFVHVEKPDDSD